MLIFKASAALQAWLVENNFAQKTWSDPALFQGAAIKAVTEDKLSPEKFTELQGGKAGKSVDPADVFGALGGSNARVKKPSERYSSTKSVAKHVRTGLPVRDERGREVQTTSELE